MTNNGLEEEISEKRATQEMKKILRSILCECDLDTTTKREVREKAKEAFGEKIPGYNCGKIFNALWPVGFPPSSPFLFLFLLCTFWIFLTHANRKSCKEFW